MDSMGATQRSALASTKSGPRLPRRWTSAESENRRAHRGRHLAVPYRGITHPDGPNVKHRGALHPPGFRYSWKDTSATLARMKQAEEEENPFDCYHLTYANPITGGPTF